MEEGLVTALRNKASRMSLIAGLLSVIPLLVMVVLFFMHVPLTGIQLMVCLAIPLGEIASVSAISAGGVSLAQIKKSAATGKGYAIAGIVLGILGVTSTFLAFIISVRIVEAP